MASYVFASGRWPDPERDTLVFIMNPIEADLPGHWIPMSIIKKHIEMRVEDRTEIPPLIEYSKTVRPKIKLSGKFVKQQSKSKKYLLNGDDSKDTVEKVFIDVSSGLSKSESDTPVKGKMYRPKLPLGKEFLKATIETPHSVLAKRPAKPHSKRYYSHKTNHNPVFTKTVVKLPLKGNKHLNEIVEKQPAVSKKPAKYASKRHKPRKARVSKSYPPLTERTIKPINAKEIIQLNDLIDVQQPAIKERPPSVEDKPFKTTIETQRPTLHILSSERPSQEHEQLKVTINPPPSGGSHTSTNKENEPKATTIRVEHSAVTDTITEPSQKGSKGSTVKLDRSQAALIKMTSNLSSKLNIQQKETMITELLAKTTNAPKPRIKDQISVTEARTTATTELTTTTPTGNPFYL